MRKRRLKVAANEQASEILIKHEVEWLAEDKHAPDLANQELEIHMEPLRSIKTEDEPFHTDAEANAVQEFTPVAQTDEYLKTELMLDEEYNMNDLEENCNENVLNDHHLVGAGIADKKSEAGELSSLSDPSKLLRNVNVAMLSKQFGKADSITRGAKAVNDASVNSNEMSTFICEECGSRFTRKSSLKTHMLRKHFGKEQANECEICLRSYTTKLALMKHLRIHSKDSRREFACDLCGKTFYEERNLNMHKKIHNGDRYPCKVCGHRFTRKESLKKHIVRSQHFDNKTQQFTPQSSNNDVASLKADKISDEEFLDEGNGSESVSHAEETQQPALAGDNKKQAGNDIAMNSATCEVCHNSYPGELIKDHMRLKHNNKCEFCSRAFKTKRDLNVHRRIHSKDRRREFACDLCEKAFYEKKCLNIHKKIHNGDRYPCKVCGHRFTTKSILQTHMVRRQHFDKPEKCTPQSSNNDVASMKTERTSDEEFIDEENGSESVSHAEETQQPALAGDNKQQSGVDTAVDSVTCEVCHNIYPGELIKAHMRLTHGNKDYKCQFCSRSYRTKFYLNVHLRSHSKDRRREFACDLCGKTFYEKQNLSLHKKVHNGDRYPCKVCGHLFKTKANLKTHMVRSQHFDDKTQQFTPQSSNNDVASLKADKISDEEFIDEGNGSESVSYAEGSQHNNQQTGVDTAIDSVTCEVCHNIYPADLIKAHMRLTHSNKDFKCQFCSRSYTTKFALTKHLRTHSKDRRREFACDFCGKTFYEKSVLSTHEKIHTGDGYPCKVCGHSFTRKSNLKTHMLRRQHFDDKTQQFTPQSSNNGVAYLKTDVTSDEEFIDEGNSCESASNAEGTQ